MTEISSDNASAGIDFSTSCAPPVKRSASEFTGFRSESFAIWIVTCCWRDHCDVALLILAWAGVRRLRYLPQQHALRAGSSFDFHGLRR